MYYEEQIINDVLCSRGSPYERWRPLSPEDITAKLHQAKQRLVAINGILARRELEGTDGDTCVREIERVLDL